MKVSLIVDCGDRAESDPCDGAFRISSGSVAETDTSSVNGATLSVKVSSTGFAAVTRTASLRPRANPGAVTSTSNRPGTRLPTANVPSAPVTAVVVTPAADCTTTAA